MAYRKYDPMVKKMIIESGNRKLFPDLNIPRTKINYWLKESKERVTVESEFAYEYRVQKLKEENFELKAKNLLLKKMYHKFLEEVEVHNLKGKEKRKQAIELIESFRDFLTLKEILKTIGVSPSSYYRWRVEAYGCETNKYKRCNLNRANQLTAKEVETLIKYATLPQFRKFSTVSLMHYCKRHRILHCSLDSWYKYLKLHGIVRRTTPNRRKKQYKNGLRAKKVNEYWHIDLTELKYGEKDKAYLQIVIDNYSRLIVAWKLSNRKTMDLTYKAILKSFHFAPWLRPSFVSSSNAFI